MELKTGCKQADAGAIPADWRNVTVGQLVSEGALERPMDGNHGEMHPKTRDFVSFGVPFITANCLKDGKLDFDVCTFIRRQQADSLRIGFSYTGDVLLSHKATIGNTAIVGEIPYEYIMLTPQVTCYRVADLKRVSNLYLKQYFGDSRFQEALHSLSGGGTRAYIGISAQLALPIVLPGNVKEQRAIAEALSDADALIESLEQLLAKKRQIKQGAMQELLTGKKRLPGFSGAWKEKSLNELFDFGGGLSASREQLGFDGYCYLHYGDIHTCSKTFIDVRRYFDQIPKLKIPLSRVSSRSLLADGDVVFVDASEDDEGTSKHIVVINEDAVPFISGLHTIVAKGKTGELVRGYKRYCFQTRAVKSQFKFYAVGTKVSGISKSNIAKIMIPVPTIPEQTAIAEALVSMDAEIDAIEIKLAKARQLKQGMMQELLTGRIRLV